MKPLAALLVRDLRVAVRVGGGALTGVLFFLIVAVLMPFATGPDPSCWRASRRQRSGSARCWRACWRSIAS